MDQGEVRRVFLRALEVGREQQTAFLAGADISPETRDAVRMLLLYDQGAESMLDRAIAREQDTVRVGDRFGIWELRELVGRGGMGAVFKAERSDGELQQVVAIKILEFARLDPRAVERFRRERQILAGLIHPHIARLLDGGSCDDGTPYLVMEYVSGMPIDQFCEQHNLGVDERLRLFLPVCDAVAYAHASLVVHRDLKPANILVSSAGEPKLLDFGIATVLQYGGGAQAPTLALTPFFASPEQARGGPVTTATDVYGLGAVLYHLLTGRAPHDPKDLSLAELQRAICEEQPTRPGLIRPELGGDLENILGKALHIDPARRYRYVAELADDIQRYLDRRPVLASPDSVWYRSRRFLLRHRAMVIAGLLATTAIVLGLGIALYEGRKAQHRFDQVRGLSNKFLFDFEKSIANLPGALPARRMIASTAREYLQSLAADARGDKGLARELAMAYAQLGSVELSLGQSDAAIDDMERAVALHKAAKDDCCGPAVQRLRYVQALVAFANIRNKMLRPGVALDLSKEAVRVSREWKNTEPREPLAERALVIALEQHAVGLESAGRLAEATEALTEAVDRGPLSPQYGEDTELQFRVARAALHLSSLHTRQNDPAKARIYAAKAREQLDTLLARSPQNRQWRRMRITAESELATALRALAGSDQALRPHSLETAKAAYEMSEKYAREDPQDMDAADLHVILTGRLANQLLDAGRAEEALVLRRESIAEADLMVGKDPKNRRHWYLRESARAALGQIYINLKQWQLADEALAGQEQDIAKALAQAPDDAIIMGDQVGMFRRQAETAWHQGKPDRARERVRRGFEVAAWLLRKDPSLEKSLANLQELRQMAREYGVPDATLTLAKESQ